MCAVQPSSPTRKGTPILPLVMRDLTTRAVDGLDKYGTLLRAKNGRDALADAYQEALDLCMYLRQLICELDEAEYEKEAARHD